MRNRITIARRTFPEGAPLTNPYPDWIPERYWRLLLRHVNGNEPFGTIAPDEGVSAKAVRQYIARALVLYGECQARERW